MRRLSHESQHDFRHAPEQDSEDESSEVAFPYRQLIVLGMCRICEPIAFMSIFPYIYFMVESFHITTDPNRTALYAGLVTSVFAGAECIGAGFWGSLSDRVGRKPVLLTGLAGTGLSMLIFGFAPNLPVALIARAIGGALNGNIGVLQTTVNEVVKVEAHQARAYAVMPTVWCLGAFIGSGLGGSLADPVRNYPGIFKAGTIFEQFPYLLTNLVCTAVVVFSLLVGVLFLEETHEEKKDKRDIGREIGASILRFPSHIKNRFSHNLRKPKEIAPCSKRDYAEETLELMGEEEMLPDYRSTASSPDLSPTTVTGLPPPYRSIEATPRNSINDTRSTHDTELQKDEPPLSISAAFTKQVMFNIIGYGILAYHTISAEQLLPVLLSLPKSNAPSSLPFKFMGGFALPTKSIGGILSVQGVIQMIATMLVFPYVNHRIGNIWTYRVVVLMYPLLYFLVPYASLLPENWKLPAVYAALVWKVTAQAFAFPSSSIMLANAAPSSKVLGSLNGAAASTASASRAVGPTVSGLVQSAGLGMGVLGLPWWVNAGVAVSGAILSLFMVEENNRFPASEKKNFPRSAIRSSASASEVAIAAAAAAAAAVANPENGGTGLIDGIPAISDDDNDYLTSSSPTSPLLTKNSMDIKS